MTHKHPPMSSSGEFWWKGRKQIGRGRAAKGERTRSSEEAKRKGEGGGLDQWGGGEFPFFYVLHILSCGICIGK